MAQEGFKRKLATILSADVEDYLHLPVLASIPYSK